MGDRSGPGPFRSYDETFVEDGLYLDYRGTEEGRERMKRMMRLVIENVDSDDEDSEDEDES